MTIDRLLLAWLSLIVTGFDLLGGLYLAYDLRGGTRGPLWAIVRAASYALVFGLMYTAGMLWPFARSRASGLERC